MIIQHTADKAYVLFNPEDIQERKILEKFPGFLRQGLQFYCPNKQNVIQNLYQRLKTKIKNIKYTAEVAALVNGELILKEIPEHFTFHTPPLKHQLIALRFAYTFQSFLNLCEPGLGKTKVTLDYIWLMQAEKSVIVCPKSLLFVWEFEGKKHRPELDIYVVKSTDWEAEKERVLAADVVVINYDKAVSFIERLKGLQIDFLAVDEGLIKDTTSDRTKALTELSRGVKYKSVMSGTLINNSPLDMFGPVRFTEPCLVGNSFYNFKEEYAVAARSNKNIVIGFRKIPEIKAILACCGIIMTKAEWLKHLPPKKFIHKYIQMGDVQRDVYQRLASNYLVTVPGTDIEVEVENPLTALAKLNQISNGFLYYRENVEASLDELYGKEPKKKSIKGRETYVFEEQPKAEALVKLIKSAEFNDRPNGDKKTRSIIWFNLSAEREIIEGVLTKAGISYLVIAGGEKDIGGKVNTFNKDPSYQFLLCQAKTINYGVTVMGTSDDDLDIDWVPEFDPLVSDEIFYSLNFSLEVYLQQQDRIHRIGQTRECRYWILLTNSPLERKIADRLENKLICNREILVDILNSFKGEGLIENNVEEFS